MVCEYYIGALTRKNEKEEKEMKKDNQFKLN